MTLRMHRPGPPLDRFIECFWHNEGDQAPHRRERLLPNGSFALLFNLGGDRLRRFADDADREGQALSGAAICGVQTSYAVRDTSRPRTVLGVHFRPGGAAPLLGLPASLLTDRHAALDDFWGARGRELHERLMEASTAEARFRLIERALLARLEQRRAHHPAVSYALRQLSASPALLRIAAVREKTGYGAKRFIALFRDSVGVAPKMFCRVRRFQGVIELLSRGAPVEWSHVALDGGFSDQPHLNREFRAFAGITPLQYRPVAQDRPNHVAIKE